MKVPSFFWNPIALLCIGLLASFLWSCGGGVGDSGGNTADKSPPTVTISYPQVNSSVVGTAVYSLTFSEAVTGLTGNNLNAACEGSIQLNPSNGGNCYPLSISSTDNISWTVDPVGELSDGAYKLAVTSEIKNLSAISLASPTSVTFNVKDALSTVANQLETDLVKAGLSPSLAETAKSGARSTASSETNDLLNVIPAAFDGAFDAITAAGLNEAFTQAALSTIIESLLSNVAGQASLVGAQSSTRVAALPANFSTLLSSLTTRVATKSASNSTILQTLTTALVSSLPAAGATATEIETTYVSNIVQTSTMVVMTTTTDTTTRDSVLAGLGAGVIAGARQISAVTVNVATIQTATTTMMTKAAASSDAAYDVSTATTALLTAVKTETPTSDQTPTATETPTSTVAETTPVNCFLGGQTITHGNTVTAYQASAVAFGGTCVSESRSCSNGILSGSFNNLNCTISPGSSCSIDNEIVPHGLSVTAYSASSVTFGSNCISEMRTCNNGLMSGSFTSLNCQTEQPQDCLMERWRGDSPLEVGKVKHGGFITVYNTYSVPEGESCVSEKRTCTDGFLSGSFFDFSCVVRQGLECAMWDGDTFAGTVGHLSSVTTYETLTVDYDKACNSEVRTCYDGEIGGNYFHRECNITNFKKISDDIIKDINSNYWALNYVGRYTNWSESYNFCNNLNTGGYNDWRLPSKDELASFGELWIVGEVKEYFPAYQYQFWSSTTLVRHTCEIFEVCTLGGVVDHANQMGFYGSDGVRGSNYRIELKQAPMAWSNSSTICTK